MEEGQPKRARDDAEPVQAEPSNSAGDASTSEPAAKRRISSKSAPRTMEEKSLWPEQRGSTEASQTIYGTPDPAQAAKTVPATRQGCKASTLAKEVAAMPVPPQLLPQPLDAAQGAPATTQTKPASAASTDIPTKATQPAQAMPMTQPDLQHPTDAVQGPPTTQPLPEQPVDVAQVPPAQASQTPTETTEPVQAMPTAQPDEQPLPQQPLPATLKAATEAVKLPVPTPQSVVEQTMDIRVPKSQSQPATSTCQLRKCPHSSRILGRDAMRWPP